MSEVMAEYLKDMQETYRDELRRIREKAEQTESWVTNNAERKMQILQHAALQFTRDGYVDLEERYASFYDIDHINLTYYSEQRHMVRGRTLNQLLVRLAREMQRPLVIAAYRFIRIPNTKQCAVLHTPFTLLFGASEVEMRRSRRGDMSTIKLGGYTIMKHAMDKYTRYAWSSTRGTYWTPSEMKPPAIFTQWREAVKTDPAMREALFARTHTCGVTNG